MNTVTIKEISESLGLSLSQGKRRAAKDGWPFLEEVMPKGGKRRVYPLADLPKVLRDTVEKKVAAQSLRETKANLPAQMDLPLACDLKNYQRGPMESRAVVLAEIDRLVMLQGLSQSKAINALVEAAKEGMLSPDIQAHVARANARGNGSRSLTRATVYNWLKARSEAGGNIVALAPTAAPESDIPEWATPFMKIWSRPVKHSIPEILDDLWPDGVDKPSYDQVRRFLKKLDALTKNRGRIGPRALQQMKAYKSRDVSELWPGAIFIGDGHTHKARWEHPLSGQPFRPEITSILDVYTRKWVGWSAALSENTWAVADALRHALMTATSADIFYYDNGSGANNKIWDDDCTGLCARQNIFKLNSAPWTSQARGIIERFHSTVLHRVARRSVSYVGNRMDDEAKRRIFKVTEADIKATGKSKYLPSWQEGIAEINAQMDRYNNAPHSTLPKIIDPETGQRRHMSPNEMWAQAEANGWVADPISVEEARDLFRPAVRRKVNRALINWIGNEYFHPDLEALHGEEVMVAYDLHDAKTVTVSMLDGRWICDAVWGGHKTEYVPKAFVQHIHEQRVAGQLARVEKRRDNVIAQNTPQKFINHQAREPFVTGPVFEVVGEKAEVAASVIEKPYHTLAEGERPRFSTDTDLARWLIEHPTQVSDNDRNLLLTAMRSKNFLNLLDCEGVDITTLRQVLTKEEAA